MCYIEPAAKKIISRRIDRKRHLYITSLRWQQRTSCCSFTRALRLFFLLLLLLFFFALHQTARIYTKKDCECVLSSRAALVSRLVSSRENQSNFAKLSFISPQARKERAHVCVCVCELDKCRIFFYFAGSCGFFLYIE